MVAPQRPRAPQVSAPASPQIPECHPSHPTLSAPPLSRGSKIQTTTRSFGTLRFGRAATGQSYCPIQRQSMTRTRSFASRGGCAGHASPIVESVQPMYRSHRQPNEPGCSLSAASTSRHHRRAAPDGEARAIRRRPIRSGSLRHHPGPGNRHLTAHRELRGTLPPRNDTAHRERR